GGPRGLRLRGQAPGPVGVERPDRVPDRLGGTPEGGGDLGRLLPGGTRQQNLGPAEGKGVGRSETRPEGVPLGGRQRPDEQRWLHPVRVEATPAFHRMPVVTALGRTPGGPTTSSGSGVHSGSGALGSFARPCPYPSAWTTTSEHSGT